MSCRTRSCTVGDLNPSLRQVVYEVSEDLASSREEALFCYETTTRDQVMALFLTASEIILISNYKGATSFRTVFIRDVYGFDDMRGENEEILRVLAGGSAAIMFYGESKQIIREVERKLRDVLKAIKKA